MIDVLVATSRARKISLPAEEPEIRLHTVERDQAVLQRLKGGALPDVMLLDFDLPGLRGMRGIESCRRFLQDRPLGVFLIGAPLELARRLMLAGADAVLPSALERNAPALSAAISLLSAGERFVVFPPDTTPERQHAPQELSDRELQVLQGLCDGLQNKEIAHAFGIKEVTVKMHVRAIIRKLGVRNRTQAALMARDLGIV